MIYKFCLGCSLALIGLFTPLAVTKGASQNPPPTVASEEKKQLGDTRHTEDGAEEGQRIFDQNCSRCHTAPEGFSPRISGTVLHHMRVRASLSEEDERALMRFLNP
jgi:cytochrome c5